MNYRDNMKAFNDFYISQFFVLGIHGGPSLDHGANYAVVDAWIF